MSEAPTIGWFGIARLGLVQAALGGIVVFTTVTLNRVMVVELALPALLPGALVALHYALQVLRPRMGFGSDVGGRRTPWILGGMGLLALGGIAAAAATALMAQNFWAGLSLAIAGFTMVGLGVSSAGTTLLVLMATRVAPERRAAAATLFWLLMIFGIALTATLAGKLLQPFALSLLVPVATKIAIAALLLTLLAVWRVEPEAPEQPGNKSFLVLFFKKEQTFFFAKKKQKTFVSQGAPAESAGFIAALREVWAEKPARRFAVFVFVSMLAYSAQELILEPFAGAVFGLAPGLTAKLTGLQHAGVMAGILMVGASSFLGGSGHMKAWTVGGCIGSALALLAVACVGLAGATDALRPMVLVLGAANGAFAVSAIGAMMGLASQGRGAREGTRMGLWGAAQATAFGAGGLYGTGASDLFRTLIGAPAPAYAVVFASQAAMFLLAAKLAVGVFTPATQNHAASPRAAEPFKEIAA